MTDTLTVEEIEQVRELLRACLHRGLGDQICDAARKQVESAGREECCPVCKYPIGMHTNEKPCPPPADAAGEREYLIDNRIDQTGPPPSVDDGPRHGNKLSYTQRRLKR
jgi:hypothetical protein